MLTIESDYQRLELAAKVILRTQGFDQLLAALRNAGYELIGPIVRDGAIVYDRFDRAEELPTGWTDVQAPGSYRLERREEPTRFGYSLGPHSWKKYLHLPLLKMWRAERKGSEVQFVEAPIRAPQMAFVGVRPCELSAIAIQDRIFLSGRHRDPHYAARREAIFVVAVNCTHAGGNCFCASTNTGPRAESGFDLSLTELTEGGECQYVVEIGSDRGAKLIRQVQYEEAKSDTVSAAAQAIERASQSMHRSLDTRDIHDLLLRNLESPRWEETAKRCLACANCTMVCPTCFCTTVDDVTDLSGQTAERVRRWDSCFTTDFTHMVGGSVRNSIASRYRQWLTHKLGTWSDQFDTLGCVGCGRCITWCPVGIDITEEVRAIRESDRAKALRQKENNHGNADSRTAGA